MITVLIAALIGCGSSTTTPESTVEALTTPASVETTTPVSTTTTTSEDGQTCVDTTNDGVDQCAQPTATVTVTAPATTPVTTSTGTTGSQQTGTVVVH